MYIPIYTHECVRDQTVPATLAMDIGLMGIAAWCLLVLGLELAHCRGSDFAPASERCPLRAEA